MEQINATLNELVTRAEKFTFGDRKLIGITGAPGVGKSTVAKAIVAAIGDTKAAFAPMDGFHLANAVLEIDQKKDRKGALDTFDGEGYVNLLKRIKSGNEEVIYAPDYYRSIEETIGSALPIKKAVPLVITEGNYLLFTQNPWGEVKELLDESWFIELDEEIRIERLIKRHMEAGKSQAEAEFWAKGSDQRNAEAILALKERADLIITLVE